MGDDHLHVPEKSLVRDIWESKLDAISTLVWGSGPVPRLQASRDKSSGEIVFPPMVDASPLAVNCEPIELNSKGELYSYTVIHPSPKSGHPRARLSHK